MRIRFSGLIRIFLCCCCLLLCGWCSPFHGWQFEGTTGKCGRIPYAKKIPATAKTPTWEVYEINGSIFLHYDVDHAKPGWFVPSIHAAPLNAVSGSASASAPSASAFSSPLSLRQQRSGWKGRFHGSIRADVPGNIQELVAKHADSWSGDLMRVAPAEATGDAATPKPKSAPLWSCIDLQWADSKHSWSVSNDAPCATLSTTARLTLLGLPLPFLSFAVSLLHVGPSLVYTTFRPQSLVLRWMVGEVVLLHATRPDSAFISTVEMTASTRRSVPRSLANPFALAYTCSLPLQRLLSTMLLRLWFARFAATCLPIYSLGKVRPLSLHNSEGGTKSVFVNADAEPESPEGEEEKSDKDSSAAIQPSSPEKHRHGTGSAGSAHHPRGRRVAKRTGYTSSSAFYSTFLQKFYSDSGNKKQDGLEW